MMLCLNSRGVFEDEAILLHVCGMKHITRHKRDSVTTIDDISYIIRERRLLGRIQMLCIQAGHSWHDSGSSNRTPPNK